MPPPRQTDDFARIRSRLLNTVIIVSTIFALPALVSSLLRSVHAGWQWVMSLQVGAYLLLLGLATLHRRVSLRNRAVAFFSSLLLMGFAGLMTWGLIGMAVPLLIGTCILASVFLGVRVGMGLAALVLTGMSVIGGLVITGTIVPAPDLEAYATSAASWSNAVFSAGLCITAIAASVARLQGALGESVRTLRERTDQLERANVRLEDEVSRRRRTEDALQRSHAEMEGRVEERTAALLKANEQLRLEIHERELAEQDREELIRELRDALSEVNTLSGLLPICSGCKKIRDDQGYWSQIETYIRQRAEVSFSHGLCPDCMEELYPKYADIVYPELARKKT